jgi:hypothetical protein
VLRPERIGVHLETFILYTVRCKKDLFFIYSVLKVEVFVSLANVKKRRVIAKQTSVYRSFPPKPRLQRIRFPPDNTRNIILPASAKQLDATLDHPPVYDESVKTVVAYYIVDAGCVAPQKLGHRRFGCSVLEHLVLIALKKRNMQ